MGGDSLNPPDPNQGHLGHELRPCTSAIDEASTVVPPLGSPLMPVISRRRSNASRASRSGRDGDIGLESLQGLVRTASAMGHDDRSRDPKANNGNKNVFTIEERGSPPESTPGTAANSRRPSISATTAAMQNELGTNQAYPDVGTIASWRGALVLLCTCGAQLMDNVFMTGVNIALPAIQKEFDVPSGDLHWLISAYTLTFGGFLLLSGVLADRYGRRLVFCLGLAILSLWTLANGLATSYIQLAVFRALQGIGAAATVPSAIGIISNYFVARDRTMAVTIFGMAGAVGFCVGLIFGGFLTSSLGWRYIFFISMAISAPLGILGWFTLPKDRLDGQTRPKLDFAGAGLSTAGLILLSFILSSGGEYGWNQAFIIALLIVSIAMIVAFAFVEKKVANPVMPLSLWKLNNFAALWIGGFVAYGGYQATIYYMTLMAQEVIHLTAGQTALRFLPMGATGFLTGLAMPYLLDHVNTKLLMVVGMVACAAAPISAALLGDSSSGSDFWDHVFPTSIIGVAGVTIVYGTITVVLLASVPVNVKSLCGGMINTAFQIGSGVALAVASAVVTAVDINKGHGPVRQYSTGMWCCVGLAGFGTVASVFGVKNVGRLQGALPSH